MPLDFNSRPCEVTLMQKLEFIKICGLTTLDTIEAVIKRGATHLGFIFFEKSPRHVDLVLAKTLGEFVAGRIPKVAVSVDADDAYLDQINEALKPDLMQLHGKESRERVQDVKSRYDLPVLKAFSIRDADDLENALSYHGIANHLLFDAKPPAGSDLPGGNGVAFDWEIMDQWPCDVPYILSGGLNAGNVQRALEKLDPWGVDGSSGVESAPGVKDENLIREFLASINEGMTR